MCSFILVRCGGLRSFSVIAFIISEVLMILVSLVRACEAKLSKHVMDEKMQF